MCTGMYVECVWGGGEGVRGGRIACMKPGLQNFEHINIHNIVGVVYQARDLL